MTCCTLDYHQPTPEELKKLKRRKPYISKRSHKIQRKRFRAKMNIYNDSLGSFLPVQDGYIDMAVIVSDSDFDPNKWRIQDDGSLPLIIGDSLGGHSPSVDIKGTSGDLAVDKFCDAVDNLCAEMAKDITPDEEYKKQYLCEFPNNKTK